jgi:hypothetical protein
MFLSTKKFLFYKKHLTYVFRVLLAVPQNKDMCFCQKNQTRKSRDIQALPAPPPSAVVVYFMPIMRSAERKGFHS